MKKETAREKRTFGDAVEKARRDGVPPEGIADLLIRIYGFDAGNARKIVAAYAGKMRERRKKAQRSGN